ncbi:MAG TPA: dTDP-4-dehydrorhamnose 3,5-epimerase [Bacteroidetes bacterium]|nr:dTDP-4-dehydrorhamnose 3,5-epimerase [Bacteroidota bacterium]
MDIERTELEGLYILKPRVYADDRGYFFESYNDREIRQQGLHYTWVQDNQSKSSYGVVRGLHYQLEPFAQTKLVRVVSGKILDTAVDLRKNSPTFGKWKSLILSDDNFLQILIPKGFAHGFSVLSEEAIVFYKCDEYYHPEAERGIRFDDTYLEIDWQIPPEKIIVSEKDKEHPAFNQAEVNFQM